MDFLDAAAVGKPMMRMCREPAACRSRRQPWTKKKFLDQARGMMIRMIGDDVPGAEAKEMFTAVDLFIRQEVAKLSLDQILERFITPMDVLAWFQSYMAGGRVILSICA
jgi:hypothetical protein